MTNGALKSASHNWMTAMETIASIASMQVQILNAALNLRTTGHLEADAPENAGRTVVMSSNLDAQVECGEMLANFAVNTDIGKRIAQNT